MYGTNHIRDTVKHEEKFQVESEKGRRVIEGIKNKKEEKKNRNKNVVNKEGKCNWWEITGKGKKESKYIM